MSEKGLMFERPYYIGTELRVRKPKTTMPTWFAQYLDSFNDLQAVELAAWVDENELAPEDMCSCLLGARRHLLEK